MKRLSLVILLLALGSLAFAQVGIGVHAMSGLGDVADYGEGALLAPTLASATAEIKFLPFLGINGAVLYDIEAASLYTFEFGAKAYVPLFILQPSLGFNYVLFPDDPESYAYAMKAGLEIGNLKRFTVGAELTYYGIDPAGMIDVLLSDDLTDFFDSSLLSVGVKLWL